MLWIPLSYLVLSTLTPGPVTILTIHQAIRYGRPAGTAVGLGGALTTTLFVAASLLVSTTERVGLPLHTTTVYQQGGAVIILMLGLLSGYKVLFAHPGENHVPGPTGRLGRSFLAGMGLMAPYFPQSILFYTVILTAYELPLEPVWSIFLFGMLKLGLTLGWYSLLAQGAGSIQTWFFNRQMRRMAELTAALFLLVISITLLFY